MEGTNLFLRLLEKHTVRKPLISWLAAQTLDGHYIINRRFPIEISVN